MWFIKRHDTVNKLNEMDFKRFEKHFENFYKKLDSQSAELTKLKVNTAAITANRKFEVGVLKEIRNEMHGKLSRKEALFSFTAVGLILAILSFVFKFVP